MDYLSQNDLGDMHHAQEIRLQLKSMFLENPLIDNNFALLRSTTGGIASHPFLDQTGRCCYPGWRGTKAKLSSMRSLGLSPVRITKIQRQAHARSLAEGNPHGGSVRAVHSLPWIILEILLSLSSLDPVHYTKLKQEDTYKESIRQLIDDIDSMKNMFVFAAERELLDRGSADLNLIRRCGCEFRMKWWANILTDLPISWI